MSYKRNPARRNRSILLKFYVNEEENKKIEFRMKGLHMKNKSAYLREMALHGFIVYYDFPGLHDLQIEINRIGVNLNQLTRHVNDYRNFPTGVIEEIQADLDKVVDHYCNNISGITQSTKRKNTGSNNS